MERIETNIFKAKLVFFCPFKETFQYILVTQGNKRDSRSADG